VANLHTAPEGAPEHKESHVAEGAANARDIADGVKTAANAARPYILAKLEASAAEEADDQSEPPAQGDEPVDGGQPTEGGQPVDGQPTEGGQPVDGGQPTEGGQPVDGQPTNGGVPTDGGKLRDGNQPVDGEPSKTVDEGQPADAKPVDGGQPADGQPAGDKPTDEGVPTDGGKLRDGNQPVDGEPGKKVDEGQPADAKPTDGGDKPVDGGDKPVDGGIPTDAGKLRDGNQPVDGEPKADGGQPADAKPTDGGTGKTGKDSKTEGGEKTPEGDGMTPEELSALEKTDRVLGPLAVVAGGYSINSAVKALSDHKYATGALGAVNGVATTEAGLSGAATAFGLIKDTAFASRFTAGAGGIGAIADGAENIYSGVKDHNYGETNIGLVKAGAGALMLGGAATADPIAIGAGALLYGGALVAQNWHSISNFFTEGDNSGPVKVDPVMGRFGVR
jgi:hypothetical protein